MYGKLRRVKGWLARSDYEIFKALLKGQAAQGTSGSLVEIGTHHGKSLIPLLIHGGRDKAYVIDIFDDQDQNLDGSGHGDLGILKRNLARFGLGKQRLVLDARLSSDVTPNDILSKVGQVRFFHIDGGHHLEAITADIALADQVMAEGGIIAIDDVFRPEWPEVSMGVFQSKIIQDGQWRAFAIGFNKTYFCQEPFVRTYQDALLKVPFLRMLLQKQYQVKGDKILVFQQYPSPHWGMRRQLLWWTEVYWPSAFPALKGLDTKLRAAVLGRRRTRTAL